jgi:hypothetical protein
MILPLVWTLSLLPSSSLSLFWMVIYIIFSYNNKTYRIKEVDFNKNIMNTFFEQRVKDGSPQKVSVEAYMQTRYPLLDIALLEL